MSALAMPVTWQVVVKVGRGPIPDVVGAHAARRITPIVADEVPSPYAPPPPPPPPSPPSPLVMRAVQQAEAVQGVSGPAHVGEREARCIRTSFLVVFG